MGGFFFSLARIVKVMLWEDRREAVFLLHRSYCSALGRDWHFSVMQRGLTVDSVFDLELPLKAAAGPHF